MPNEIKDCRWPWNRLYLHANGDIKPCCYATGSLGKANQGDTLESVWNGQEMVELRTAIERNAFHPVCAGAGCSFVRSKLPEGDELENVAKFSAPAVTNMEHNTIVLARLGRSNSMFNVALRLFEMANEARTSNVAVSLKHRMEGFLWLWRSYKRGNTYATCALAMRIFYVGGSGESLLSRLILQTRRIPLLQSFALKLARQSASDGYGPAATLEGLIMSQARRGKFSEDIIIAAFKRGGDLGDADGYLHAGNLMKLMGNDKGADHLLGLAQKRGAKLEAYS